MELKGKNELIPADFLNYLAKMERPKTYVTCPIYYASGQPHIGHLHTTVLGDFYHRWFQGKRKRETFWRLIPLIKLSLGINRGLSVFEFWFRGKSSFVSSFCPFEKEIGPFIW